MEFRDRKINAGSNKEFVLAKYDENNEKHREYLKIIETISSYMASCLKVYPQIHAVSQCEQSYFVLDRFEEYIGSIVIEPSAGFSYLIVKILLNDDYFEFSRDKADFLKNLISSLMLLFFDFKNIKIEFKNYFTISEKNSLGVNGLNAILIDNCMNYRLIPEILEELKQTKASFSKNFTDEDMYKFIFEVFGSDNDIMKFFKDFKEDKLKIEELFCHTRFITLRDNVMNNGNRIDVFSDGSIILKNKLNRASNDGDYIAYYNVLNNGFNLFYNNGEFDEKSRVFELVNNSDYMRLNFYGNSKCIIKKSKKDNFQDLFYKYIGRCSSFEIKISTDEDGKIESCSADVKVKENDCHFIVKTFYFWISHSDKIIHLKTISKGGVKVVNYSPIESENLQDLMDSELSFDTVCNFIREFSIIISDIMGDDSILEELDKKHLSESINFEHMAFQAIDSLRREVIKYPHLRKCFNNYIEEYNKKNIQDKVISFKKDN